MKKNLGKTITELARLWMKMEETQRKIVIRRFGRATATKIKDLMIPFIRKGGLAAIREARKLKLTVKKIDNLRKNLRKVSEKF